MIKCMSAAMQLLRFRSEVQFWGLSSGDPFRSFLRGSLISRAFFFSNICNRDSILVLTSYVTDRQCCHAQVLVQVAQICLRPPPGPLFALALARSISRNTKHMGRMSHCNAIVFIDGFDLCIRSIMEL